MLSDAVYTYGAYRSVLDGRLLIPNADGGVFAVCVPYPSVIVLDVVGKCITTNNDRGKFAACVLLDVL